MTVKIMISIPDELKAMIEEYNENHMFKKLHISEICQQAIYNEICSCEAQPQVAAQVQSVNLEELIQGDNELPQLKKQKTAKCIICDKEFTKKRSNSVCCSDKCQNRAEYERKKVKKQAE
jgi:hypothetical protein